MKCLSLFEDDNSAEYAIANTSLASSCQPSGEQARRHRVLNVALARRSEWSRGRRGSASEQSCHLDLDIEQSVDDQSASHDGHRDERRC